MQLGIPSRGTGVRPYLVIAERVSILAAVLGLYYLLMLRYPIIYGGDTVVRLVNPSRILNGHQLPLLQVLIQYTTRWSSGPEGVFILMALISGIACAGLHALTLELTGDRRAAWLAAAFYVSHPFVLYYSRVPYQEPLLFACLAWGYYYLFRPESPAARVLSSLLIGAACLTRYEGWIAALAAALFQIRLRRREEGKLRPSTAVKALVCFGWAPALWILWNRGLSPAGTHVLDLGLHWGRFYRPYFIVKSALWWTESAVALLAVLGFAGSWLDARMRRDERFHSILAFLALFLAALLFSGHGIEPEPTRMVTEREAFVPIGILVFYAAIGSSWLIRGLENSPLSGPLSRVGVPLLAVLMVTGYSFDRGFHRIAAANDDPELKSDYQVAQFLAQRRAGALVLAAPLPTATLTTYLDSVERWSGKEGRAKALLLLQKAETTPLDYQRVLVFSWMGKNRVLAADQLRDLDRQRIERFLQEKRIDYLVVFSDFAPVAEHERALLAWCADGRMPEFEVRNGDKSARIFRIAY